MVAVQHHKLPETQAQALDRDYRTKCEVATMSYLGQTTDLPIPRVYAYKAFNSTKAKQAGAPYMLLEGLYGNSLADVNIDLSELPHCHLRFQKLVQLGHTRHRLDLFWVLLPRKRGDIGPFSDAVDYFSAMVGITRPRKQLLRRK